MNEKVLTEQDLKVLNKIAEEASGMSMGELLNFLGWEDYAGRIFSISHKKEIEHAVILSRQETEKKQVPVVSIEWLEEYYRENKKDILGQFAYQGANIPKKFLREEAPALQAYNNALSDLLSAARKKLWGKGNE